jgi:purine-binding chemotaxis protein CheW
VRHRSVDGAAPAPEAPERCQLVVLRLGGGEYGLAADAVVQVLRMVAVTPVPESPAWIAGVINLRGRTTPVMDLRERLHLPAATPGLSSQIVVVRWGEVLLGLIADAVLEVLELGADAVEPAGEIGGGRPLVAATARTGDRLIVVLDTERLAADSVQPLAAPVR